MKVSDWLVRPSWVFVLSFKLVRFVAFFLTLQRGQNAGEGYDHGQSGLSYAQHQRL